MAVRRSEGFGVMGVHRGVCTSSTQSGRSPPVESPRLRVGRAGREGGREQSTQRPV